jgi:hypothetical protein
MYRRRGTKNNVVKKGTCPPYTRSTYDTGCGNLLPTKRRRPLGNNRDSNDINILLIIFTDLTPLNSTSLDENLFILFTLNVFDSGSLAVKKKYVMRRFLGSWRQ